MNDCNRQLYFMIIKPCDGRKLDGLGFNAVQNRIANATSTAFDSRPNSFDFSDRNSNYGSFQSFHFKQKANFFSCICALAF